MPPWASAEASADALPSVLSIPRAQRAPSWVRTRAMSPGSGPVSRSRATHPAIPASAPSTRPGSSSAPTENTPTSVGEKCQAPIDVTIPGQTLDAVRRSGKSEHRRRHVQRGRVGMQGRNRAPPHHQVAVMQIAPERPGPDVTPGGFFG